MHLRLEDQAQHKVEETNDKESRGFVLLYNNTKQHCVCVGIIKNGKDLWDQAKKRQVGDPGTSPKKKARPQFSGGEGRKRESGILVWNKKGWSSITWLRKSGERCTNPRSNFLH